MHNQGCRIPVYEYRQAEVLAPKRGSFPSIPLPVADAKDAARNRRSKFPAAQKKGKPKLFPSEKAHCNAGRDMNGKQLLALSYWLLAFSFSENWELRTETLSMDRIVMLSEILAANPEDSFARYGLAQEYSNAGQIEQALQEFKTLIEKNPDYTPAYFMAAQALAKASRVDEAKRMLVDGISSARRTGNAHAQSEMTAMLEELG